MVNDVLIAFAIAAAGFSALPCRAQAAGIAGTQSSVPQAGQALDGARLVSVLRGGGYVIYFRHTATDFSKDDLQMKGLDDCANQRPLTVKGRLDAQRTGERIRELRLAGGEVLASPMCRTMEHAQLVFARATPTLAMREFDGGDFPGLKQLLASPVEPGRNRWLFGHGIPFRTVAGPPQLNEGEAVVIKPTGQSWVVVARIAVDDWAALPGPP